MRRTGPGVAGRSPAVGSLHIVDSALVVDDSLAEGVDTAVAVRILGAEGPL